MSAQEVLAVIYYGTLVRSAMGKTSCVVPAPATRSHGENGYYRCQDGHIFLSSSNHISGTGW